MKPKRDRCGSVAGAGVPRPARPRSLSQARVDMLGALRQLAPATAQELAPLLGVHDQSARGVLLRLLTAGLVGRDYTRRPTGVHSGNGAYRWWLTAAGTAALEQQEREGRCVLLGVGSVRR